MKMIGVGLGRSGTMWLKAALEELTGEPSFHMIDLIVGENRDRDLPCSVGWDSEPLPGGGAACIAVRVPQVPEPTC